MPTDGAALQAALVSALKKIQEGLSGYARSTEGEFLEVGSKLHEIHRRSGELSKRAATIVDLMLGDEINSIMHGLQDLFARITHYAGTLESESRGTESSLREVLQKLDKVGDTVSGFRKIVKTMTILGLSTKIENARNVLDEESFNILADDLVNLARNIDLQARQVQGQLQTLDALVREALQKVLGLKSQQRHHAQRVLSDTMENIALLAEKNQRSSNGAGEIAALTRSIADKVSDVVASIQSHDLTRQQIEHVVAALADLERQIVARFTPSEGIVDLDRFAGEICRLQEAQIENSRNQLLSAVSSMQESLREIAVGILSMADQTQEIAGATNEAGISFLAEMEQGAAMISSALNENAHANRESVATLTSLARSVAQMEDFLLEIERIGGEMKVLALNAGIKAARISEGGAGLSVIAEAIQKLSGNAVVHTTVVSDLLREITDMAQMLSSEEGTDLEAQGMKVQEFLGEIGALLQSLRDLNGNIVAHLTGVGEEGRSLAEEIDFTASGISVREKTIKLFDPILGQLKSLASPAISHLSSVHQDKEAGGMYCDLMGRYTMHSEREIHRSVVDGKRKEHGSEKENSSGSEFGENVELF